MADHSKPTITSNYLDFVSELHGRMDDLAVGLDPARASATNVPNYSIRWSSVAKKWQYLDGSIWKDLTSEYAINISGSATKLKNARTISITGGGTAPPVQFDGSADIQLILESLDLANLTGLGSAAGVDVVQSTGNSEDDVMSQKAVADALNTKNTQGTGSSQTRTNSQNDNRFIQGGSVVQGTGSSTTDVMSQKAVIEAITPIGMTYTQYPGTETPSTLFGGTWTLMFNTEGVFFRTEGGYAGGFGSQAQGDAIRNISGWFNAGTPTTWPATGVSGVFSMTPTSSTSGAASTTYSSSPRATFEFSAGNVVPVASENRPRNRTIRVWRKTAH